MIKKLHFTFYILVLLYSSITVSQTITWTGTGTNDNWNNTENWDLEVIPSAINDVVIPTGFTVIINISATTQSIAVAGNSQLTISNSLSFTATSSFAPDVLTNWISGNMLGGGTLTNMGTLNLSSGSSKSILDNTTLSNTGTINITGSGDLLITQGTLNNMETGVIDMQAAAGNISFSISGDTHIFNNAGTIRRSTSTGTASISAPLTNTGTISVEGETTLSLLSAAKNFNGGMYNVSENATFLWSVPITVSGVLQGTLDGALNLTNVLTVDAASPASLNFTGTTAFNWVSGSLMGGGTLTNMGILNLSTGSNKSILENTTLSNTGTINITGSGDLLITQGTLNNMETGVIDMQAAAGNISFSISGDTHIFNNAGILRRSTSTGTASINTPLTNTGTISVEGETTLSLLSAAKNFNGGIYNVSENATFLWSGPITVSGVLQGTLDGALNLTSVLTIDAASPASLNFTGITGFNWVSGSLMGGGTLTNMEILNLSTGSNKSILENTTLSNTGTINITGSGDLLITQGTLNNMETSVIDMQAASGNISFSTSGDTHIFNNAGILRRSTSTGTASINTPLTNTGAISVEGETTLSLLSAAKNFNGGIYNVSENATFLWSSPITVSGVLQGTLDGALNLTNVLTVDAASPASLNFTGTTGFNWVSNNLIGGGTLTNMGILNLSTGSNKSILGNTTLSNTGTVNITGSGDLLITQGTLNNTDTGIVDMQAASGNISFQTSGDTHIFNNAGLLRVSLASSSVTISTQTTNTGIVEIASGELILGTGSSFVNEAEGVVTGASIFDLPPAATDFTNNGSFSPGIETVNNPSTLTVQGNFSSLITSTLEIDINGALPNTEHDVLAIQGDAIFEGEAAVSLGFDTMVGDEFTIATVTGTIATANLQSPIETEFNGKRYTFEVSYPNDDTVLLTTIERLDIQAPEINAQAVTATLNTTGSVTIDATNFDNGSLDNCSDNVDLVFTVDRDTFTCSDLGVNMLMFTVADEAGNSDTVEVALTIEAELTTFDNGVWSPVEPGLGSNARVSENLTTTSANITSCTCEIDENITLTVAPDSFLSVIDDITVNGTLIVEQGGSVVQIEDDAQTINNNTIEVRKETPSLEPRDFILLSSPMSNENRNEVYGDADRVFGIITSEFTPDPDPLITGLNFLDEDGSYLDNTITDLGIGTGFLVFPQAVTADNSINYTHTYTEGTLNNGEITVPITYNGATATNFNLLGNPYPSAIDADMLIANNPAINEVYYWEHITQPNETLPGFNTANFSMDDISIRNLGGGVAAGNGTIAPDEFMASGQGFGILAQASEATTATPLTFTNQMRVTGNNSVLKTPEQANRLWLQLDSETYTLAGKTLINFLPQGSIAFDPGYDSHKLGTTIALYSLLEEEELVIQTREVFDAAMTIPLGFSSIIPDNENYTISIDQIEGDALENNAIFLWDTVLNQLIDLKESSYTFTAIEGIQNNRFMLVFEDQLLSVNDTSLRENSITLFPNPASNALTVDYTGNTQLTDLVIIDPNGKLIQRINTTAVGQNNAIDISNLKSGLYFIQAQTENTVITQKLIKN